MAKKELIDSGSSKRYAMRSDTAAFVRSHSTGEIKKRGESSPATTLKESRGKASPASTVRESSDKGGSHYRDACSGRFLVAKEGKSSPTSGVRGVYSMPNGEKIVTVRRDIVDRAIGRKKT